MRNFVRKLIPDVILERYRAFKKSKRNKELELKRISGDVISLKKLEDDIRNCGITLGDTVLVHSSLSKIGFVEGGAETVVNALLSVIGSQGNLLMPTSPNSGLQLDYVKKLKVFDVAVDESKLGAISECFRTLPNCLRSAHPTEPVSCLGPDAEYFTKDHFGQQTPYTSASPFCRVSECGVKIVYLGVTLDNAGTNLHTLEDAVANFKYPVYFKESFQVDVKFPNGEVKSMTTKVHNPEQSIKRKCDDLIPLFKENGILKEGKIGQASTLIVDAKSLLSFMIEAYTNDGVTMYTPRGE